MSRERNSGIVLGLLAGAAIGSILGVLFAPEKGEETRKKVRRKAEELRDEALEHYEELSEKAKHEVDSIVSKAKRELEKYKGQAKEIADEVETEIEGLK